MKRFVSLALVVFALGCVQDGGPDATQPLDEPVIETTTTVHGAVDAVKPADEDVVSKPEADDTRVDEGPDLPAEKRVDEPEAEPEPPEPESLRIPDSVLDNCVGFLTGGGGQMEMELIKSAGGGWSRPHPGAFTWGIIEPSRGRYDFNPTDAHVRMAQEENIATLATVWPFADWDQGNRRECEVGRRDQFHPDAPHIRDGPEYGIPKYRCAPSDDTAYKAFLTMLVERYDGDGVDDMPGLTLPVKHWEILNEPEMDSPDLTFYKGGRKEYVELLKLSYEAVKSACSDCVVVQGGAAGSRETLDYWGEVFDLGGGSFFDVANIHFIGEWDVGTLNVKDYGKLMRDKGIDKPIWVTEAQLMSDSEAQRAFEGAINAGASKVFFVSYEFGEMRPPRPGRYSKILRGLQDKCGKD